MTDLKASIAAFLTKWNSETYIVLRIESIMGLLLVLYIIMFVLVIKRFSPAAGKTTLLDLLDVVTESIFVYVLGAMQAAPFQNVLFPVWALMLVSFRSCVKSLSTYGAHAEFRNVFKLSAVAYMKATSEPSLWGAQFWIYWSSLVLKCFIRIFARYWASKSLWHGRSSEVVQKYMGGECFFVPDPDACNPETMTVYKYLVYGESKLWRESDVLTDVKDSSSLITLDKIWQYDGPLNCRINKQGNTLKDLCLAFALSRLLRCRLEGGMLHEASVAITRKLIFSRILTDDTGNAFRILAMDLAFLSDQLHTSYPIFFSGGIWLIGINGLLNIVRYYMALYIGIALTKEKEGVQAINTAGLWITWATLGAIMIMECMEIFVYELSDWTGLMYACEHVGNIITRRDNIVARISVRWASVQCRLKLSKKLVGTTMGQYVFLESFNYSAWKWRLVEKVTIGMLPSKDDGMKPGDDIKLPQILKVRIFEALDSLRSKNIDSHFLPRDLMSSIDDQLPEWCHLGTCLQQLPTCSHVILVWHIATSLCEMKMAQDPGMDSLSFLTNKWWCCCSPRQYLLNENSLRGDLRTNYEVANSLSRYCAYLLVSKPDLLPDAVLVPKVLLQNTVWQARQMLKDCDSLQSIYDKLINAAEPAPQDDEENSGQGIVQDRAQLSVNILHEGARLAEKLIDGGQRSWEILAKVWVNLLVYIAPSSNAEAHGKYLKSGGELLTIIWALLCHCGIEKSELWQDNK